MKEPKEVSSSDQADMHKNGMNKTSGATTATTTAPKTAAGVGFLIYLAVLLYLLFFAVEMGRTSEHASYNLVLFSEIGRYLKYWKQIGLWTVLINLVGNVVAFVPFGMLVPYLVRKLGHILSMTAVTFLFSLFIETMQLLTRRGSFDVDDMLLNTIGGIIGYLIFTLIRWYRQKG